MPILRKALLAAAIATPVLVAHAVSLETMPAQYAPSALSAQGATGAVVAYADGRVVATGNQYLASDRSLTYIGGYSSLDGFAGNLAISADGRYIGGTALGSDGTAQAARYDVASGTWTTLGGLGGKGSSIGSTGVTQSSAAYGFSADGSTAVGYAYTSSNNVHATVFRNGTALDLTPTSTSTTMANAVNGDGTVIAGYVDGNAATGRIWRWNAATSSYGVIAPTATNPWTGASGIEISLDAMSSNGQWAAGNSVNQLSKNFAPLFSYPTNTYSQATLTNAVTGEVKMIPFDHVVDTSSASTDLVRNMKATVRGVSDSGNVIGMFNQCLGCTVNPLQVDAWIYLGASGTTMSFDSYLASVGFGLTATQHVFNLQGMSADGSSITGLYYDSATGLSTGFIVHDVSAVPEPGQWAMLALGLPLLLAARRRRSE